MSKKSLVCGADFVDFKKLADRFGLGHLTGTFPNKKGDFGKKGILESSDRSQSNIPTKTGPPNQTSRPHGLGSSVTPPDTWVNHFTTLRPRI